MSDAHEQLAAVLRRTLPAGRVFTDPLHLAVWGADASVYRMIPRVVVRVADEAEVAQVLAAAADLATPVTFRAGGTSLSGQAVTDSVLVMQEPRSFRALEVLRDGVAIRLGPGVVGAEANDALAAHMRRIGPDPASLSVARIGGIVVNNASGMCCGPAEDSYHTLLSLRGVLADGTVFDTGVSSAREALRRARPDLLARLAAIAGRVREDAALCEMIRRKFRIKNTVGYALNALIDHHDPIDVLQHLLVGSEGTLAFVSEVTLRTVEDPPQRACVLAVFADVETACRAATSLVDLPVSAAELMDRASLRAVESARGVPEWIAGVPDGAAALLVEVRAGDANTRAQSEQDVLGVIAEHRPLDPPRFEQRGGVAYTALWRVRKGLAASVGAARPLGTSIIIEDVAVPREHLAACVRGLREIFERRGYGEAIVFGHALAGNLHYVVAQRFDTDAEIERYAALLDDVAALVADRLGGSLKAEHGTGRNMAPFVEREWGRAATAVMREIKAAFDPDDLLNPGVILNDDPRVHLRDLKSRPLVDPALDPCIECGFCEPVCPSRDLTLTPRQRIVALREMAGADGARRAAMESAFAYAGDATCATDGVCAVACPVAIDTGRIIKARRAADAPRLLEFAARHFAGTCRAARTGLRAAGVAARIFGDERVERWSRVGGRLGLPAWRRDMPSAGRSPSVASPTGPAIVHFSACPGRVFGYAEATPLDAVISALAGRVGLEVARPAEPDSLCCGLAFESQGRADLGDEVRRAAIAALSHAARGGRPIVVDASPCARHLRDAVPEIGPEFGRDGGLEVLDVAEWLRRDVITSVPLAPLDRTVTVHVPCSGHTSGLDEAFLDVARACARTVIPTPDVVCCGQAGDRGFRYPELPAAALDGLDRALPRACQTGYSSSRTCEIALERHSGRTYTSIAHLVLEAAVRGESPAT